MRIVVAIANIPSPRNPRVESACRSSKSTSLDVVCRRQRAGTSVAGTPQPLSATVIWSKPSLTSVTSTDPAPASNAFSTSSLTADATPMMTWSL